MGRRDRREERGERALSGVPGLALAFAFLLLGSACDLPRDPNGTLDRVRNGVVRVGVIERPPWTIWTDSMPRGVEPALVEAFARELGARIAWTPGSETEILGALVDGQLDLVIGGLTASTPWKDRIGITKPFYVDTLEAEHIMALPRGENGWLVRLERFLHRQERHIPLLLRRSAADGDPASLRAPR